jgi:hypothetical protein
MACQFGCLMGSHRKTPIRAAVNLACADQGSFGRIESVVNLTYRPNSSSFMQLGIAEVPSSIRAGSSFQNGMAVAFIWDRLNPGERCNNSAR